MNKTPPRSTQSAGLPPWQAMLISVLACSATTLLATPLLDYLDLANIVMLFLLTVLLVAVKLGRRAAVLASILSVLLFDIFFVPPRFSLAVSNIQYLVTFAVMLVTALITGHLAAGLKQKAQEAQLREERTQALYDVARQLAGALNLEQAGEIVRDFIQHQFGLDARILPAQELGPVAIAAKPLDARLARMALESSHAIREDHFSRCGSALLYLPLQAADRGLGVLEFADAPLDLPASSLSLLAALASLLAITVERLHYVDVAQTSQVHVVSERLRSSILSALSHDLRTPLTALVGLADALFLIKPSLPPVALESAQAIQEQASRLAGLVGNLLDMARLNAGDVQLRREWQPLEEVIGAAIKLLGSALAESPVRVALPPDLPLLAFDAVLLERVFCNLLENAAKYSPAGSPIDISAREAGDFIEVSVADHGPGFPSQQPENLFDMFVRGPGQAAKPGTGLGLAICRAIIEAHGGTIQAGNGPDGGARLSFSLPRGTPPVMEEETP